MPGLDILPICTTREARGRVWHEGGWKIPCYCVACAKQFGFRDEPGPRSGYVGFICDGCAPKWGEQVGIMLVPEEAIALKAAEAMCDDYGRVLREAEQLMELADVNSPLSRFARSVGIKTS